MHYIWFWEHILKSLSLSLASLKCALSTVSKQIVADFLCKCLTGESFYLAHTWCTLCTGPEHWEVPNENFMVRSSYMIYIYDIYIMLQKSTKIVLSARGVRHPTWFNSMLFEFCKKNDSFNIRFIIDLCKIQFKILFICKKKSADSIQKIIQFNSQGILDSGHLEKVLEKKLPKKCLK